MGNWRRVQIIGTCAKEDVSALFRALNSPPPRFEGLHCLSHTGGACGLPNWAAEKIEAVGNLAERGYDQDSIAETLQDLAAVAPSLTVQVNLGGDHESDVCVATIYLKGGKTIVDPPAVATIPELPPGQMSGNILGSIFAQMSRMPKLGE